MHPPQRSFKPRRRSLSPARIAAYERSIARWGIDVDGPQLSLQDVFGDPGEVVLDIGFGGGEALIELAEVRPSEHVIGVDVHTPGIAAVLEAVEARGLRNVRVVEGDVVDFAGRIPPRSLDAIRVFFPDPWPKRRQRGRRLICPDVVARFVPMLRVGGEIQLTTDSTDYAMQMRQVCDDHPGLVGGVIERPPWRPTTRYEQRGIDEGRRAVDLLYTASARSASDASSACR
jgi:tRNA (guanine-N7-)-methyltransferase